MDKILEDVKELIEIDVEEEIYDRKLVLHINSGIAELINNAIPISLINEESKSEDWQEITPEDYQIVCDWLYFYVIGRIERPRLVARSTTEFMDRQMTNLLYQLSARYDK